MHDIYNNIDFKQQLNEEGDYYTLNEKEIHAELKTYRDQWNEYIKDNPNAELILNEKSFKNYMCDGSQKHKVYILICNGWHFNKITINGVYFSNVYFSAFYSN